MNVSGRGSFPKRTYHLRSFSIRPKIFFLVVALISILSFYLLADKARLAAQSIHPEQPCFAEEWRKDALREMLFAWDSVMQRHNLVYWIEMGTLLGSTRFRDIVPWDHDADLAFLYEDTPAIKGQVAPDLEKDFQISLNPNNPVQLSKIVQHPETDLDIQVMIDVFAYATYAELRLPLPEGKTTSTLTRATYRNSNFFEEHYCDTEMEAVFPLRTCQLGRLNMSCPNDVDTVLTTRYPYSYWMGYNVPFKIRCYANPFKLFRIAFQNTPILHK